VVYTHSHLYIMIHTRSDNSARNMGDNKKPLPWKTSKQDKCFFTPWITGTQNIFFYSVHHNHQMRRFTSRGRKSKRDINIHDTCIDNVRRAAYRYEKLCTGILRYFVAIPVFLPVCTGT